MSNANKLKIHTKDGVLSIEITDKFYIGIYHIASGGQLSVKLSTVIKSNN